jgi:hypothetical protein
MALWDFSDTRFFSWGSNQKNFQKFSEENRGYQLKRFPVKPAQNTNRS